MGRWCLLTIKSICFLASAGISGACVFLAWHIFSAITIVFVPITLFFMLSIFFPNIAMETIDTIGTWIALGISSILCLILYFGILFISYSLLFRDGDLD